MMPRVALSSSTNKVCNLVETSFNHSLDCILVCSLGEHFSKKSSTWIYNTCVVKSSSVMSNKDTLPVLQPKDGVIVPRPHTRENDHVIKKIHKLSPKTLSNLSEQRATHQKKAPPFSLFIHDAPKLAYAIPQHKNGEYHNHRKPFLGRGAFLGEQVWALSVFSGKGFLVKFHEDIGNERETDARRCSSARALASFVLPEPWRPRKKKEAEDFFGANKADTIFLTTKSSNPTNLSDNLCPTFSSLVLSSKGDWKHFKGRPVLELIA
ncbi:exocyst subunit exo70 family protein H7 [Striga asiatica]|uniref:Exocyst subunit exo70 family protein H7 n=1 Tax=Striga asiatica TaxID=4170 RepID=A0A5A7QV93_STRAF|nr:exocyst subunit exo70 family protein H7 [Striga asiatica]